MFDNMCEFKKIGEMAPCTGTVIHGRVCQFFGVRHSPQGGDARDEKARAEGEVFCLTTYASLRKIGDMAPF